LQVKKRCFLQLNPRFQEGKAEEIAEKTGIAVFATELAAKIMT
jgi:hypothetical protein